MVAGQAPAGERSAEWADGGRRPHRVRQKHALARDGQRRLRLEGARHQGVQKRRRRRDGRIGFVVVQERAQTAQPLVSGAHAHAVHCAAVQPGLRFALGVDEIAVPHVRRNGILRRALEPRAAPHVHVAAGAGEKQRRRVGQRRYVLYPALEPGGMRAVARKRAHALVDQQKRAANARPAAAVVFVSQQEDSQHGNQIRKRPAAAALRPRGRFALGKRRKQTARELALKPARHDGGRAGKRFARQRVRPRQQLGGGQRERVRFRLAVFVQRFAPAGFAADFPDQIGHSGQIAVEPLGAAGQKQREKLPPAFLARGGERAVSRKAVRNHGRRERTVQRLFGGALPVADGLAVGLTERGAVDQLPGTRRAQVIHEIVESGREHGVLCLRHIRPVARTGGIRGGGEHGLRLQTVTNGRTRSLCRASRSRGRESSQRNRPERAGREWYAASVQLPGRRVRLQAVLNGRTRSLSVSRAAGKVRDTRDGVLRLRHIRPVARAGGIHGGERGLRLQTVTNGRTRSLCRASRSRGRGSSQWNRPERAGREWYVRWCAASVQLPGRRARLAASGRSQWTDAKPFREPRSRGRESSQWNRPERAGREWYAASVQLPGRRARLQAVLNGRTRRLSVSRAAGKVRDTRDGILRLRHIRPVARAAGIHGGERGLRLQTVICGRTRSLCRASRSRGRESSQWNRPERAGRG